MQDMPLAKRLEKSPERLRMEALVAKVEARLRSNPEEGRGWDVLAPVYCVTVATRMPPMLLSGPSGFLAKTPSGWQGWAMPSACSTMEQ